MRDLVWHPDSKQTLDFAAEDFGGPEQTEIIEEWKRSTRRPRVHEGEFICVHHQNHERPSLYLNERGSLLVASHWMYSGLAGTHEIVHRSMTPEHKRQTEYVCRAGEAAGWRFETEKPLPGIRPDAVIYGSHVSMGVEAQRSELSRSMAKARTTKARRVGVTPVWFSDHLRPPSWELFVPGVRMSQKVGWDEMPPPRTVMVVSGVREIVARKCRSIRNVLCPNRPHCNAWHADHEPFGIYVDDLAEKFPAGKLVPIQYRAPSGNERVLIVRWFDKEKYETVTGLSGDLPLKDRKVKQQTERIRCSADAGTETPFMTSEGWVFPPYVPAPRCEVHGTFMMELVPGRHYCRFCFQASR